MSSGDDATPRTPRAWERVAKRSLDLIGSAVGLAIASPVILGVAIAIGATMGRPVFFRQVRPGLDARPIRVWKFRTMSNARAADGTLLPDADRLTRVGRFLRDHSLDELPQLLNVLRGDMSFVGPRPLLMRYLPRYSRRQALRHCAKPGITGWAQVHGRNALDWDARLELDVWYVEHQSFWLDLEILARTAWVVVAGKDVRGGGLADFTEFLGSDASAKPQLAAEEDA